MKKTFLFLVLLLLSSMNSIIAQNNDWQSYGASHFLMKQEGNILYLIDSTLNVAIREDIINRTKESISLDLSILNETEFSDSIMIAVLSSRYEMYRALGISEMSHTLERNEKSSVNIITCVYDPQYFAVNKELTGLILESKWRIRKHELTWLKEGLVTYINSELDNCDGYNLETRYACIMQNGKFLDILQFPPKEEREQYKIACNQSAYIVEYLLSEYGIEKLKELSNSGMKDFDKIYQVKFDDIVTQINKKIGKQYSETIRYNKNSFSIDCVTALNTDSVWLPSTQIEGMLSKVDANIKYTISPMIGISERNNIIEYTKKSISQNLAFINEAELNDNIHIFAVRNREEMQSLLNIPYAGMAFPKNESNKENMIYCIYWQDHNSLKHELMHLVIALKWGGDGGGDIAWLDEGLCTLAYPESEDCDGHTFEERYVYFLQNNMLLDFDALIKTLARGKSTETKVAYNQSAYIIGYLLENYGIEKLKGLWQTDSMKDFKRIYGLTFEDIILEINKKLKQKYPDPINFNLEQFNKGCII